MKFMKNIFSILSLCLLMTAIGCSDDANDQPAVVAPEATAGGDQTVDLEKTVTLDASASVGVGLAFNWSVTDPDGQTVSLDNSTDAAVSFVASKAGMYTAEVSVTNNGGTVTAQSVITVENPTYSSCDQMGRPAINTVFNYFGDAAAKNGYNMTTPEGGNAATADFEFILDNLQAYIGLDPDTYNNVLGLDNTTTASVLTVDVLMSNKDFSTTYGPSDLNNISLGENVLNGRGLGDDVIDVTLILAFAGDDLNNLSATQMGLISDNVQSNDKSFAAAFPYLADPH